MHSFSEAMRTIVHGAPVWAWLLVVSIVVTEDLLARSTRFKANSIVQVLGNACAWARGTLVGKFPVLAQLLAALGKLATPVMLALILVAAPGCKGFGIDFGRCELGSVPATVSSIEADVAIDLQSGLDKSEIEQQLLGIAAKTGIDAVTCVVLAAVNTFKQAQDKAQASRQSLTWHVSLSAAIDAGEYYLARHPHK